MHNESNLINIHLPCPTCGSSDAYSEDASGGGHCFSCGYHKNGSGRSKQPARAKTMKPLEYGEVKAIPERGLDLETCTKYDYQVSKDGKKHLAFMPDGSQKIRFIKDKKFLFMNKAGNPLFGADKFDGGTMLIITEGEIDAMTAYQLFGVAAVSISHGTQAALKCVKDNIEYLKMFGKILLAFDDDESGRDAQEQVMKLLEGEDITTRFLPYANGCKDLNDVLATGGDFEQDVLFREISWPKQAEPEPPKVEKTEYYYVESSDKFYAFKAGQPPRSLPSRHMMEHLTRVDHMEKQHSADFIAEARSFYGDRYCSSTIEMPYTKPGVTLLDGHNVLNTSALTVTQAKSGNPTRILQFLSELLGEQQKMYLLSWLSHFYKGCKNFRLTKGQAIWLGGDQGSGKTLFITKILPAIVGPGGDATPAVTSNFTGDAFKYGFCHIDDKLAGLTQKERSTAFSVIKGLVASSTVTSNKKYGSMTEVNWNGRVIVATNLGIESASALPSAESGDKDKYSLLKCNKGSMVSSLSWDEWHDLVEEEKHFFADYLMRWEIPEELKDLRFGTKAHHHSELVELVKEQAVEWPYAECIQDWMAASNQDTVEIRSSALLETLREFEKMKRPGAPRVNEQIGIRTFGKHLRSLEEDNMWITMRKVGATPVYTIKQTNLNKEE